MAPYSKNNRATSPARRMFSARSTGSTPDLHTIPAGADPRRDVRQQNPPHRADARLPEQSWSCRMLVAPLTGPSNPPRVE
jgi:hypothetical protein